MKKIEKLQRDILLKFLNTRSNESQQISSEHGPHKIYKQDVTNSLFNEDLITNQKNGNKKENYSN